MRTRDEAKEEAIKQKAISLIVRLGLEGFSIHQLAKEAGVSPATIYIYHKDKEDLIVNIGVEVAQKVLSNSLKGFSPEMSFAEGLRVQWKNRATYFMKNPIEVEFIEQLRYSQIYIKVMQKIGTQFKESMSRFICNAIDRQEVMKLPFEVYWAVAFAPLYQLIKFHNQGKSYVNEKFELKPQDMELTLELVLKALKPH